MFANSFAVACKSLGLTLTCAACAAICLLRRRRSNSHVKGAIQGDACNLWYELVQSKGRSLCIEEYACLCLLDPTGEGGMNDDGVGGFDQKLMGWAIQHEDIEICRHSDGEEWLLVSHPDYFLHFSLAGLNVGAPYISYVYCPQPTSLRTVAAEPMQSH